MNVGDGERRSARPVQPALGQEPHPFSAQRRFDAAVRLGREGPRTRPVVERERGGGAGHVLRFEDAAG
jgi:hypothetical protein